jgi:curved DNA-binding protein
MEYKDYYKILQVDKKASEQDIKRSFRKLARQYHPDKNPDNKQAEEKFKEINEANEVLGNPENRAKYDQLGQNYYRHQQMGGAPNGFDFSQWAAAGGPGAGYQRVNIDFDDILGGSGNFSDFFSSIFGGSRRGPGRGARDSFARQAQVAGQNVDYPVEITLEEAFHGTSRTLTKEGGDTFTARIPRGAKSGTKVRLRGKGGPGPAGPGDLYLVIQVTGHDTFKRKGNDLKVAVPVSIVTTVLGGKAIVPTLTGPVKLTIPAGTQGDRTIRLKGKGMPHLRDNDKYGDLLATVQIKVPKTLSDEERRLYEQLAELSPDNEKHR